MHAFVRLFIRWFLGSRVNNIYTPVNLQPRTFCYPMHTKVHTLIFERIMSTVLGGREGREGGEGGRDDCYTYSNRLLNSNPMIPQYLNYNLT